MKKTIKIDFTINKWGGFNMEDGEFFLEKVKDLVDIKPDFYIITEEKDRYFETTFIPNPIHRKDTLGWDSQDNIEMFNKGFTYRAKLEDIIEKINSGSFGIYEIDLDSDVINIDNMFWYYLGLYDTGEIIVKSEIEEHPRYTNLLKEINM